MPQSKAKAATTNATKKSRQSEDLGTTPIPPLELAFAISTAPDTRVNLQISNQPYSLVLYVACTTPAGPTVAATLGSFVYALPNRASPSAQPLSTALYTRATSLDFMTRLARILAFKLQKPVFVGGDVKFWTPEDEGVAMKGVVETVTKAVQTDR